MGPEKGFRKFLESFVIFEFFLLYSISFSKEFALYKQSFQLLLWRDSLSNIYEPIEG